MVKASSLSLPPYTPEAPRDCPRCPRLVAFRHEAARAEPTWFNGAVPSFGTSKARLLIVGLAPGEVFGLEASAAHRFSAEAVVDTRLDVLSRAAVYGRAARDPDYARSLWAMTGAHLDRAQEHMLLLGRKTAVERVAAFLLDMAERSGPAQVVELPMGRQDIADFLGLTMETVSRTLTQLERQGAITMPSARRVALTDPAELRSIGD